MADSFPAQPITVLASAARTATNTSAAFDGGGNLFRGLASVINATAETDTASVVFTVQHSNDGVTWATSLAGAAVEAIGTQLLLIHPDVVETANITESSTALAYKYRVLATHADADSITYSVKVFHLL